MVAFSNKRIPRNWRIGALAFSFWLVASGLVQLHPEIGWSCPVSSPVQDDDSVKEGEKGSADEDVVVVRTSNPDAFAKRKGKITAWLGGELTIEIGGTSRTIPNQQIDRLEVTWGDEYRSALVLLGQRRFAETLPLFSQALASEKRTWAANIIRNDLIKVLSLGGSDLEAAKQFLVIVANDPETRFIEFAPLAWDSGLIDTQFVEIAKLALQAKEPYAQLLGASWLMGTTERTQAVTRLKELSRDIRPIVAHLAAAQLWRSEYLTARQTDVDRWARQVERMPREIRAGPLFILGMAYERLGKNDEALLSLLEVPILHEDHFRLSVLCQARAARILDTTGKTREARKAWSEISAKYPQTNWANEAQSRLRKE